MPDKSASEHQQEHVKLEKTPVKTNYSFCRVTSVITTGVFVQTFFIFPSSEEMLWGNSDTCLKQLVRILTSVGK